MGWMPAARRVESSRVGRRARVLHRCVPSSVRFGSVRFGSFVRSRHVVSVAFATKSAQSINQSSRRSVRARRVVCVTHRVVTHRVVVVVCDSPLRTRAYGMVGVGRSSCLNAMEKEKVHIGRSNGYRRVASRAR